MTAQIRLDRTRRFNILVVKVDGVEHVRREMSADVPEAAVFKLRNQLCEALSEEFDEVTSKTYDWRS